MFNKTSGSKAAFCPGCHWPLKRETLIYIIYIIHIMYIIYNKYIGSNGQERSPGQLSASNGRTVVALTALTKRLGEPYASEW